MLASVNPQTILIVEDNDKINRMFYKQLSASGYGCTAVLSIAEAINHLEQYGAPDIIVLDLELGDGLSTQVLDYLGEKQAETIVIVVSANAYSKDYGLDNYTLAQVLLKPVSPRGLSALIKEMTAQYTS